MMSAAVHPAAGTRRSAHTGLPDRVDEWGPPSEYWRTRGESEHSLRMTRVPGKPAPHPVPHTKESQ